MSRENYIVARVGKYTRSDAKAIRIHNDRQSQSHKNPDIVASRSYRNLELVDSRIYSSYTDIFDNMVASGVFRTTGLKPDAHLFNEIIHDVNSEYWLSFKEHGYNSAEEFALAYFHDCLEFDKLKYGEDCVLSAAFHADEINRDLTEKYGYDVWHYHMHVVAVPTVLKEKKWSKRCKDPDLVGKVKESYLQVSDSKFWAFENGQSSFAKFQDEIFEYLHDKWPDLSRGEFGSKAKHLSPDDFKDVKEDLKQIIELNQGLVEDSKSLLDDYKDLMEEYNSLVSDYNQLLEEQQEIYQDNRNIIDSLDEFYDFMNMIDSKGVDALKKMSSVYVVLTHFREDFQVLLDWIKENRPDEEWYYLSKLFYVEEVMNMPQIEIDKQIKSVEKTIAVHDSNISSKAKNSFKRFLANKEKENEEDLREFARINGLLEF